MDGIELQPLYKAELVQVGGTTGGRDGGVIPDA